MFEYDLVPVINKPTPVIKKYWDCYRSYCYRLTITEDNKSGIIKFVSSGHFRVFLIAETEKKEWHQGDKYILHNV